MGNLDYQKTIDSYENGRDGYELDRLLSKELDGSSLRFVVLDDDPTGVQTVHGVNVYTSWDEDTLLKAFRDEGRLFFILTNSRGMTGDESRKVHEAIATAADKAASATGSEYLFISRGDSTLRGHYPMETEVLARGKDLDGEILCPFFPEGGRYTVGNVHYVRQGSSLVPAADTEFARDKTFGYAHSDLPGYIEEKTGGRYKAESVTAISLELLRAWDFEKVEDLLMKVTGFSKVVVNALSYADLKVFCIALYRAMAKGKRFIFRTAAGFVSTVSGISPQPLLSRADLIKEDNGHGGLVIVGSHTAKTTSQLRMLLSGKNTVAVEFKSSLVLEGPEALRKEAERCVRLEEEIIMSGKTAVCYTERTLLSLPDDTKEEALLRSVRISGAVQSLAGMLTVEPLFVIAKGGITSSEVGVKALKVKKAKVLGQIAPGVPVWQLGPESRFPSVPYVIFPGNVGEEGTLRECYDKLTCQRSFFRYETENNIRAPHPFERTITPVMTSDLVDHPMDFSVHMTEWEPGEKVDLHKHDSSTEVMYCIGGKGVASVNGIEYSFEPDTMIAAFPGDWHQIVNTGEERLRVLCVFSPPVSGKGLRQRALDAAADSLGEKG